MLKYDFSGVLFGEILDVSRVTMWQRGFTTVSFCVGVLNDRLDPTPFAGVMLHPIRTRFKCASKNEVSGGIRSLPHMWPSATPIAPLPQESFVSMSSLT